MWSRPAVSRMIVSRPWRLASIRASWQTLTGFGVGLAEDGDVELLADDLELLDGRGALEVGGDEQGLAALRGEHPGELAGGGRLARALEAAEHQDRRARLLEPDRRVDRPHQLDHLVVDDLDDLLLGPDGLDQLGADGLLVDLGHELLDDVVVDVGLEQGRADLAQPLVDVRLGQHAPRAEPPEGRVESRFWRSSLLEVVEHGGSVPNSSGLPGREPKILAARASAATLTPRQSAGKGFPMMRDFEAIPSSSSK